MEKADLDLLEQSFQKSRNVLQTTTAPLPDPKLVHAAAESLQLNIPDTGHGVSNTLNHLWQDIVPGLSGISLSPTYYGFVIGGTTPAARLADHIVTLSDQMVGVHQPNESAATLVEDRAACLLLELLHFAPADWPVRQFTTGATAGNILGLGCGREFVISRRLELAGLAPVVGEGILASCSRASVDKIQILTTLPHSTLGKAANIVGVGSASIVDVSRDAHVLALDLEKLEKRLSTPRTASIVAISCGEVNTGSFATNTVEQVQAIRALCDKYHAWLHVDGAFGIYARALPDTPEFAMVRTGGAGMHLADSIGGDGHKLLNVPYDCGFFVSRHAGIAARVCQNTNAAYLATKGDGARDIPSPLNTRLENSARFRGLPVYATLVAYGRQGYETMLGNMVRLARTIAAHIRDECAHLELLGADSSKDVDALFMCVLFRARDPALNAVLVERINASRQVYGSGTTWAGSPAARFAVAKWDVDVARDLAAVKAVLASVA